MSGIDVKMGVSGVASFQQAMATAQRNVKSLDAALKLNEKQLQATGDKETYMAQKADLLKKQIAEQNTIIKQGQQALSAMEKQGVKPSAASYQKLQQQVLNAQAALIDMNGGLNTLGQSEAEATQKTDQLSTSLSSINKKVSFDAVLGGIGKITSGMEAAARKVEALARDVWDTMAMAASWADNENTLAAMYGIDVETLQRMQGASRTIDTSVEAIIKSRQKLKQNMASDSKEISEAFNELGVSLKEWGPNGILGNPEWVTRNWEDVFWDLGEALTNYTGKVDRDVLAQKLFGRNWMELMPLFKAGREEYQKTMDEQSIVTQENVDKLNALDDALQKLDQDYQATKNTILAELAPAFTTVGDTVSGLLGRFNEYLQTKEGKEKLSELSEAVTELFSGLSDVDFGNALDTAKGILDGIVGALTWIGDHHKEVEDAIKGIGGAFVALKVAEGIGILLQGVTGLKGLLGSAGTSTVTTTAAEGGGAVAAAGRSFLNKILTGAKDVLTGTVKVAPFAAPFALMVDSFRQSWETQMRSHEWQEATDAYVAARTAEVENMQGDESFNALRDVWYRLSEIMTAKDNAGAGAFRNEYAQHYSVWDDTIDALIGTAGTISEDLEDRFVAMLESTLENGGIFDPNETMNILYDLWQELDAKLNEEGEPLKVEAEPELPDDAEANLQSVLDNYSLTVPVGIDLSSASLDGEHANGLPYVPFDGYIAALHRGERVVPAAQNKSYSVTNNLYQDHVNYSGGASVDAVAAAIATRTQNTMAGFGG